MELGGIVGLPEGPDADTDPDVYLQGKEGNWS